jgi:enoyl-CoA hydratase/carnithine racemase
MKQLSPLEGDPMEERLLLVEKKEKICTITFNRPERRNALSPLLLFQLADILTRLKDEGEVRCLVLRGAGDKAFSAGYDISAIPTDMTPEMAEAFRAKNPLQTGLQAIIDFPYPVIAMINGPAFGAGCELAMTCDIRIAVEGARLSIPPAKLGIIYHQTGIMNFINIIGLGNAKEMFFTGRAYEASRAREMGLVNYVVPPAQLSSFTYEIAQEIAENAPLSLKGLKFIFNKCFQYQKANPEDAREIEALRTEAFNSEDLKEGQRAFQEKRKPVFKGR